MNTRAARLVAALALLATPLPADEAQPGSAPPAAVPRLVVFVSVDQMRSDYLERFRPYFTAGLKRYVEEGAVFTSVRYGHANTETGPGHAVLLTGRHARDSGIVMNEWYDRLQGEVNVVDDPAQTPLPGPGGRGASPASMLAVTVGDLLKARSPGSRVVGVSGKDRAAVLMTGRRADAAYWHQLGTGDFGSSTYYMAQLPAWLAAWNAERPIDRLAGGAWTRLLDDASLYERVAGPDDVRGEWDNVDTTFPHRLRSSPPDPAFYEDVRRTPWIDELTLDVALRAMDAHGLGLDDTTDLLAVGFSGTDGVGHTYGADSQEVMDQLLRLDRMLGRLLEAAEQRAGRGRVLFGLGADHGAMPLAEVLQKRGIPARRLHPDVIRTAVAKALQERFPGATGLVAHTLLPDFYLDLEAIQRQGLRRRDVEDAAIAGLLATGAVERVYTHRDMDGDPPADDPDFSLVRNSFFAPRSPHLMVRLKPYVYLSSRVGGTGHGTPRDYDRHVALAFLGPGIRAGRYDGACGPHDIAPTLAALLGLAYKLDSGQRVLGEALGAPAVAR